MDVDELTKLGISAYITKAWKEQGIVALTGIQEKAFTAPSLHRGKNLLVVAPTSSGKTFIGEVLAVRAASNLHRAIYLVPYKALAEEKYLEFREKYRDLGISVVVSSGDYSEFDQDIRRGDFGIAIIVYEKLAQLLVQSPGIIADCQVVVIDEVQIVRERDRGPLLELLLARVKRLQPAPQIVCLSATVGDFGGFDKWLDAEVIETKDRPVPLWEGVIDKPEKITVHNVATKESQLVDFHLSSSLANKEDVLESLVRGLDPKSQALVFRAQVDATERTALALAQTMPVRPLSPTTRDGILALEDSPFRSFLERNVERRVAYHNAGLSVDERRLVEALFREGVLQVIVTTSTLAVGVNLPADMVILADYRRYDTLRRTRVAIDVAEYKNCVGRAGRFGHRTFGIALVLAEESGQRHSLETNYIFGTASKLESAIPMQPELAKHVLGVIAEQLANTPDEILALFQESFAFATYYLPTGQAEELGRAIRNAVQQLLELHLVEPIDGRLETTLLGRVAARTGISIATFEELVKLANRIELVSMTDHELFACITELREMESLRPYSSDQRAELLSRWVAGEPAAALIRDYSNRYSLGYGRIRDLGEVADWLLSTTAQIAATLGVTEAVVLRLSTLAQQSHFGVPEELIRLAHLRVLQRSDLLRLVFNDKGLKFTDAHQILDAEPSSFIGILAPQKVQALKERIAKEIGETFKRRRADHLLRCDRVAAIRPLVQAVYDASGLDFERALEDFLNTPMVDLGVRRFTRQRTGQPDLELAGTKGTIVISATGSVSEDKPVSWDKSREVLGSVGYSGTPSNFVVIGKPNFHSTAVENAKELAAKGQQILLLPLDTLVELCLRNVEGKMTKEELLAFLEDNAGHIDREDLLGV